MKGVIYKATNTFNGMVYIGQTRVSFEERKKQHLKAAKIDESNRFHTALYQYPGAFEWKVIDEFSGTREQVIHFLNVAEEYHIMKNRADNPDYGYNASTGGYSCSVWDERLKKMAKKHEGSKKAMLQYDIDGNFIRVWRSISEISRSFGKGGAKNHARTLTNGLHYGYQWRIKDGYDFPMKIDKYSPALQNFYTIPVVIYDKDGALIGKYASRVEARNMLKTNIPVTRDNFSTTVYLNRKTKTKMYCFKDDGRDFPQNITFVEYKKKEKKKAAENATKSIQVAAYTKDGVFVEKFASIGEAVRKTGVDNDTVRKYCLMDTITIPVHSNAKYVWRFVKGEPSETVEVIKDVAEIREYEKKKERRVIQYSISGEFIKVWDTAYSAVCAGEDTMHFIRKSLAQEETKHPGKFIWRKYEEDYPQYITTPPSSPLMGSSQTLFL